MVNIHKLKLTILQQEILEFLFANSGKSFTGRAISISLKVSQPGVSKSLSYIEKTGLVTIQKDKDSKRLSIALNRDNPLVAGLKRANNLKQIYESGLAGFLEDNFPGTNLILFGSYSRGDDTISSDVDIAVIGSKEKNIGLNAFEKVLHRKITLNFYDSMNKIHKELRENLCNGIVLAGGIEL